MPQFKVNGLNRSSRGGYFRAELDAGGSSRECPLQSGAAGLALITIGDSDTCTTNNPASASSQNDGYMFYKKVCYGKKIRK